MTKQINSVQNPLVKELVLLKEKSKVRKKTSTFLIEGLRELSLSLQGNYTIDTVLFDASLISVEQIEKMFDKLPTPNFIEISTAVYHKLAHRDTTEGILAVAQSNSHSLNDITFKSENPLILVTEAIEKPGNIGALLRTADAANVDAVLIANPKTDVYNPNCIRSSVGCVFTNQIAVDSTENIITYLRANKINIYSATLNDNSQNYHSQDYNKATAIVVGTEATGLSQEFINAATQNIMIPMQGKIDSMNVSVSAAILIFEVKRQRNFK